MARPKKEIDQKQFENLCGLQCTLEEICGWFGVADKTLEAWCKRTYGAGFYEVFKQKRGAGKISLRLGKQYLGQKDNPEESVDMEDTSAYLAEAGME